MTKGSDMRKSHFVAASSVSMAYYCYGVRVRGARRGGRF